MGPFGKNFLHSQADFRKNNRLSNKCPALGTAETLLRENSNHEVLVPAIRRRFRHRLPSCVSLYDKVPAITRSSSGSSLRTLLRRSGCEVGNVAGNFGAILLCTPGLTPSVESLSRGDELNPANDCSHKSKCGIARFAGGTEDPCPGIAPTSLAKFRGSAAQNRKTPPIIHYERSVA